MVVVATVEYLVIRLSVVGREHQSEQRCRGFVVQHHGIVGTSAGAEGNATLAAGASYGIVEAYGRLYVQRQARIGRVVAVAGIVYHTDVGGCRSTGNELQRMATQAYVPLAQERIAKRIASRHLTAIARTVVGVGNVALVLKLVDPRGGVLLATSVREEAYVNATILLGREIGVEHIGCSHTYHHGVGLERGALAADMLSLSRRAVAQGLSSSRKSAIANQRDANEYILKDLHSQ